MGSLSSFYHRTDSIEAIIRGEFRDGEGSYGLEDMEAPPLLKP